jgi:hypothetical protein
MNFIKVRASQCTAQGMIVGHSPIIFYMNISQIGTIWPDRSIGLLGGNIININGSFYTKIYLDDSVDLEAITSKTA